MTGEGGGKARVGTVNAPAGGTPALPGMSRHVPA